MSIASVFALDFRSVCEHRRLNWKRRFEEARRTGEPMEATIVAGALQRAARPLRPPARAAEDVRGTLSGVREIRNGLGDAGASMLFSGRPGPPSRCPILLLPAVDARDGYDAIQMEEMDDFTVTLVPRSLSGGWKRRATDRIYRQATHLFPGVNGCTESAYRIRCPGGKDHGPLARHGRTAGTVQRAVGRSPVMAWCVCSSWAEISTEKGVIFCWNGRQAKK